MLCDVLATSPLRNKLDRLATKDNFLFRSNTLQLICTNGDQSRQCDQIRPYLKFLGDKCFLKNITCELKTIVATFWATIGKLGNIWSHFIMQAAAYLSSASSLIKLWKMNPRVIMLKALPRRTERCTLE